MSSGYGPRLVVRDLDIEDMMRSFEAVQIVARLAQKLTTVDSSSLVAAIKAAGPIDSGLVGHIDWSKPFSVVKSGKVVPLTGKFADVFAPAGQ